MCGSGFDLLAAAIEVSTEQVEFSISLAGYVSDVGFPGQVRFKFNTQVGMVVDFLKLFKLPWWYI